MFQFVCGCVVVLGLSSGLWAVDLPYGSDTLPYLATRATLVATAAAVRPLPVKEPLPSGARINAYGVQLQREPVLKGTVPDAREVTVVVPLALDFGNAEETRLQKGQTLFLAEYTDNDGLATIGAPGTQPAYLLVSGRYGVVDLQKSDFKQQRVAEYVRNLSGQAEARLDAARTQWCLSTLTEGDDFLKRSAVFELDRFSQEPQAIQILARALESTNTSVAIKRDAINVLRTSEQESAVAPLKSLAENGQQPLVLRKHAVDSLGAVPGGLTILQEWSRGNDRVLAPAAVRSFQKWEKVKAAPPN
uniref:HEAT repeat domain-containing protein n=1 Tax=Schlesneria paludicola TaxID=360056 RepID=A0A7C2P0G1_9PLAN